MKMDIAMARQANSNLNVSNNFDFYNSSYIGPGNMANNSTCLNNEVAKSTWNIVGIVIVSVLLGLMTLTTILG